MPEFMGFIIDEPDIPEGKQRCVTCGQLVGRGIIPASSHWADCEGKGKVEALTSAFKKGSVTIDTINKIFDR
jgi:hypothetical protein